MDRTGLAREIYDRTHLTGDFVLRSGARSTEYFDKYLFESDPSLLRAIGEALVPLIPPRTDALAGLELGGIPIATMLSQLTGLPALFVRKEAKTYGTCRLAEGGDLDGRRLTIVEDVVSSGGQVVLSAGDLRERGATVEDAVIVIDRRPADGTDQLGEAGIAVHALFTMDELKSAAAPPPSKLRQ
jgi:orotate phosphoribosyltransferase